MTSPAETTTTPASELKPKTKLTGKVVKTTLAGVLVDLSMEIPGSRIVAMSFCEPRS